MPGLPKISGVKDETQFDDKRRETHPGQAHWGGSGPKGKTCRECFHWGEGASSYKGPDYYAETGGLKPRKCGRYFALTGSWGAAVPHEAKACRDFLEAKEPPKAFKY